MWNGVVSLVWPVVWSGFAALVLTPAAPGAADRAPAPLAFPGPPWISIEVPPNPLDPETRDAFLVVHTYHHERIAAYRVTGKAEGLVNGERRTRPLELTPTSRPGVHALAKQWPDDGVWVLAITAKAGGESSVTALVEVDAAGQVAAVRVPSRKEGRWTIPRAVTAEEIEAALHARAATARADLARASRGS